MNDTKHLGHKLFRLLCLAVITCLPLINPISECFTAPLSSNTAGWNLSDRATGGLVKTRQIKRAAFWAWKGNSHGHQEHHRLCSAPRSWGGGRLVSLAPTLNQSVSDSHTFWHPNRCWSHHSYLEYSDSQSSRHYPAHLPHAARVFVPTYVWPLTLLCKNPTVLCCTPAESPRLSNQGPSGFESC